MIFTICAISTGEQHIQWIHPNPALHHLKMQVVAGAVARAAYIPDHLTSRHGFARRDGCCCHVGIAPHNASRYQEKQKKHHSDKSNT